MDTVVIAGASGFLGRGLTKYLYNKLGVKKLLLLDNCSRSVDHPQGIPFFQLDVSDIDQLAPIAKAFPCKGVINLCGIDYKPNKVGTHITTAETILECTKAGVVTGWALGQAFASKVGDHKISLIHVGSIYGMVGPQMGMWGEPDSIKPVEYAISKSGLLGLTRWQAAKWGYCQVRSNCIILGGVQQPDHDPQFVSQYSALTMLKRMASVEDLGGAVEFLLDDTKSGYVTGSCLMVEGGYTAW